MIELDIELAIIDYPKDKFRDLVNALPDGFVMEDKYSSDWGAVIRSKSLSSPDPDDAIKLFINSLESFLKNISSYQKVIRLGIFFDSANYSFSLKSMQALERFNITLEVSVYPSSE